MAGTNLEKVRAIKDEVKELHPLLEKLFPKMPRYVALEYNQGNREMGADFVVAFKHDTFDNTEYIGIVAKVGGISQSFSEVERQIDECSIPRYFRNGKEKIIIDEVWVMFTGTVTANAQEKIHEKFKTRKIVFVNDRRLADLIDKYIPSFWDAVPLETGDYLSKLKQRYEELDRSVSLIQVGDEKLYIEQDVYTYPREEYRLKLKRLKRPARKVNIFEAVTKEKISLVEGAMGAGKSKLLRKLVSHFSEPAVYNDTRLIPIPITYRELVDDYGSNLQKLIDNTVPSRMKDELEDGQFLLLVDGIDEKRLSNDEQVENLKELCEAIHSRSDMRAVLSSRPLEALEKTSELDKLITSFELRSLSLSKTIEFIRTLCNKLNIADRLVEDLKKSALFSELPRSPISVILLANIINEDPRDLPSSLTELYTKFIEWSLGRWDMKKGLQSQKEYEALDNVMMNLARYMLDSDLSSIAVTEAKQIFDTYLKPRNLKVSTDDVFRILTERTELMYINEANLTIGFKHKSFAEFFYAKAAHRDRNMLVDNRAFQLYWMNSFFFYLGLGKDIPEVIDAITNITPSDEREEFLKFVNMPNYLMAAYSSPYDVVTKAVRHTIVEAATLYQTYAAGKSGLALAKFSRMHLIWLFQALIRENYSYEFFIPALEDSALSISEDNELDSLTKMYALFFLNVAYIDSKAGKTFDFLLKDFAKSLPLDLLLAYNHESHNIKEKNDLMKKQDKRIKKLLGGNGQLAKEIDKLYENPLGSLSKEAKRLKI